MMLSMMLLFAPVPAPVAVVTPAVGNPAEWITADDYPRIALEAGMAGKVAVEYTINREGRVSACSITKSSGHPVLDATTCALLIRRARYLPARNAAEEAVTDRKILRFTWRIPDDVPGEATAPTFLPPLRPFAMVIEMNVTPANRIEGCHTSFASGLPPDTGAICAELEGKPVTPNPIGEPQVTGRHLIIRSSVTAEPPPPVN